MNSEKNLQKLAKLLALMHSKEWGNTKPVNSREQLQKLAALLKIMDTQVSKEDFAKAFKSALDLIAKTELKLSEKIDTRLGKITDGRDGMDGKDGKSIKGEKGEPGGIGRSIFGGKGEPGNDGKDGSSDTPEETRDKLESIKEEEEKLKIDSIGNLRKELDALKKKQTQPSGTGVRGREVKIYDLSDQLDGILKTFALPVFWRVFDVKLWSAPALRPTTDYTVDGSAFKITFTSQIDAGTLLAAGQTCLVLYQEV